MRGLAILILLAALGAGAPPVSGQSMMPVLRYDPPAGWYRSAVSPPEAYTSNEVNAGVQVYRFRPFSGDIVQLIRQDLLRSWIDPMFQESNVTQLVSSRDSLPGADAVINLQFADNVVGIARPHVRTIVVVHGFAAIMDAQAAAPQSWERARPQLLAMYRSLRVESSPAPPSVASGPGPAGRLVAGLYRGVKGKYQTNLQLGSSYGYYVSSFHYYLLAADGHVYRFYDLPPGDLHHFDFDGAARDDPANSGRYTVTGQQLYLVFGGPSQPEEITIPLPDQGTLTIQSVLYQKQW